MEVKTLKLSSVFPSPMNPRKTFDEGELRELAESIRQQGLLQPITVRLVKHPNDEYGDRPEKYEIICGERRYRAFCLLSEEWKELDIVASKGETFDKWSKITAIVKEMSDAEAFDAMITENLQRKDVDPIEEAFAFDQLVKSGKSIQDIAIRFGKSIRFVQDRIKLNALVPELMKELKEGNLPISAAMVISKVDEERQRAYCKQYKDNYHGFTTATATNFVKTLFLNLTDAVWHDTPCFAGGCGTTCAECIHNTANHGSLFYEMKTKDDGQCTNAERYTSKVLAYIEDSLSKLGDTLVKAGEPLEKGKMAISIDVDGYAPESVKKLKSAVRDKVLALGYEIIDPLRQFNSRCFYDYDDERTQAFLKNGEAYSVLQLANYNCIRLERQVYYVKKGDNATNVDCGGRPVKVQSLLNNYKTEAQIDTIAKVAGAEALSACKPLISTPLDDEEWMCLYALMLVDNSVAEDVGLDRFSHSDDRMKWLADNSDKRSLVLRAWMKQRFRNHEEWHPIADHLPELGKRWCLDEYQKAVEAATKKREKKLARITKQLADLGYDPQGRKLAKVAAPTSSPRGIEQQYEEIKKKHPDSILLFRVGDFYECINEDAEKAAKILNITLTKRGKMSLSGFPHHALDTYLPKLINAGQRVAICEQDPKSK